MSKISVTWTCDTNGQSTWDSPELDADRMDKIISTIYAMYPSQKPDGTLRPRSTERDRIAFNKWARKQLWSTLKSQAHNLAVYKAEQLAIDSVIDDIPDSEEILDSE